MDTLDRLKIVIKHLIGKGIAENQKSIGILLGYKNESSFSQIVNGKVPIPSNFWSKLKSLDEDINILWIESGKGNMLTSEKERTSESNVEPLNNDAMTTTMLTQMLFDANQRIKRLEEENEELRKENSALKNSTEKKESKAV